MVQMRNFILAFIAGIVLTLLAISVWSNTAPSECETLADEYSRTVSLELRDQLMDHGIAIGCFHAK
jgi:hypothetical protein